MQPDPLHSDSETQVPTRAVTHAAPPGVPGCTCPPKASDASGRRPGRAVVSGFDWHDPACPTIPGGVLSPEAQERLQRKLDDIKRAQIRAMEGAMTYVIG